MSYEIFYSYILELGFSIGKFDHYVYWKLVGDHFIYVVLYVNDTLLIGKTKEIIKNVKTHLSSEMDMEYLGAAHFIMGMEIKRDWENRKLWLNKRKYDETIFHRFNM